MTHAVELWKFHPDRAVKTVNMSDKTNILHLTYATQKAASTHRTAYLRHQHNHSCAILLCPSGIPVRDYCSTLFTETNSTARL